jgi:hypothetical protein
MIITKITVVLQKNRAVFSSEDDANLDRFVSYPELLERSTNANKAMFANQTLIETISRSWDQTNFTLTLIKLVSNMNSYNSTWEPIEAEVRIAETNNGWTRLSSTSTPV